MKLAAFQFAVSGDIESNLAIMERAIVSAARQKADVLVFPECALTGYPPRNLPNAADVDFVKLKAALERLAEMAADNSLCIIAGTILKKEASIHNSAAAFLPDGRKYFYHKRALWGWDRDNFVPGDSSGVFEFRGIKIGLRICYEVRFPEYFRELYREGTHLNIILFHDVADHENFDRYDLIRAHIRTRAVENVCAMLSVNSSYPYQTAPTMLCDASGRVLCETKPGKEALMIFDHNPGNPDFGELGRRTISNYLQQ